MKKSRWLTAIFFILFTSGSHAGERQAIDFHLSNWDKRPVSLRELKGKIVFLTFSYANCTVRCPIITGRLYFLDQTMGSPADVVYLHISTDPEKDTAEKRKSYFSLYRIDAEEDNRWMFLSGSRDELSKLWNFYRISPERIRDSRLPEGYYMEYTPKLVVLDKAGLIRFETDFNFSEDEVHKEVKEILK